MSFVQHATQNLRGFDVNNALGPRQAAGFAAQGFNFAIRYVGRVTDRSNDLSGPEVERIHAAGLGLMIVQHVESEIAWLPTTKKGKDYGAHAAQRCNQIGIHHGTTVWLDVEGVSISAAASDIALYCNAWYEQVKGAGYHPGLYVGWRSGMNSHQLYHWLNFEMYWAAYNLNKDEEPAVCGVAMRQGLPVAGDFSKENPHDTDFIRGDALGRVPCIFAPDSWQNGVSHGTANLVK